MTKPFGTVIRSLRQAKRMSLAEVAKIIGCSQPYLSDVETGRRNPPAPERIDELAAVLGAQNRAEELHQLAKFSRRAVVLRLNAATDPEVAITLTLLGQLHAERRLRGETVSKIRRLLEPYTAVA